MLYIYIHIFLHTYTHTFFFVKTSVVGWVCSFLELHFVWNSRNFKLNFPAVQVQTLTSTPNVQPSINDAWSHAPDTPCLGQQKPIGSLLSPPENKEFHHFQASLGLILKCILPWWLSLFCCYSGIFPLKNFTKKTRQGLMALLLLDKFSHWTCAMWTRSFNVAWWHGWVMDRIFLGQWENKIQQRKEVGGQSGERLGLSIPTGEGFPPSCFFLNETCWRFWGACLQHIKRWARGMPL